MDSALEILDEIYKTDIDQYDNFRKLNESSEEELNLEELRYSLKNKGMPGFHNLDGKLILYLVFDLFFIGRAKASSVGFKN